MSRLPLDHAARARILTDLDATLVVEAAAGTGKTTALIGRITAIVRSGRARLDEIVAVTFTEKAAGEMKLRLRAALEEARAAATSPERERFEDALAALEAARMGTIHGLCADLLRERPIEAAIDPLFRVADASLAMRLYDQAFDAFLDARLADPPEGIRRLLRREARREQDAPRWVLHRAGLDLIQTRDFDAPWERPPFQREAAIDAFLHDLFALAALAEQVDDPDDHLARHLALLQTWARATRAAEIDAPRDYDHIEGRLRALAGKQYKWHWRGARWRARIGPELDREAVITRRDAVKADLDALVSACEADLAPLLREALRPLVDAYQAVKHREGVLDFHDLLACTRDLLVRDGAVRARLQRAIRYVLVDEFQDTDPLQTDIVLLLAAADPSIADPDAVEVEPGKLFVVGDPKQSIYRFRRADVAFYARVKTRLVDQGAAVLPLSTSFRADPRIQDAINAALAPRMRGGTQAAYVPLDRWRDPTPGRPAVVALPAPRIHGAWGTLWERAIADSEPEAIGAWLAWLLRESGWTVHDPSTGAPTPVAARHVCLLFKRLQSRGDPITTAYTHALEKRNIAHVLVGGHGFHHREEVRAVRVVLDAIEQPGDAHAVFAALRGPLFALPDDALLAWRGAVGPLDPRRAPPTDAPILAEVHQALQVLAALHHTRNHRPFADTIHALLEATRAHAGLASWVAGDQALANVLRIAEIARRFEAAGATSFRAFLTHLDDEARRGETGEAPVVEDGTDGVRMMTVHGAKGLEFPVVVLCDITCPPTFDRPSRWVDPDARLWVAPLAHCVPAQLTEHMHEVQRLDAEEADRLLYVAATRARDVLVVPVVGEGPLERSWVAPLDDAVYPPEGRWAASDAAPGCPPFGEDSVARPREPQAPETIRPGLHTPRSGASEVVWWDPNVLALRARRRVGLRTQDLLVEDTEGRAARSEQDHATWTDTRARVLAASAAPTLRVVSPTAISEAGGDAPVGAVAHLHTDAHTGDRPGGKRFGSLVHAVLADVPLGGTPAEIRDAARLLGRILGATPAEIDAAIVAVASALRHPLLRDAARSPDCRREAPLGLLTDDGRLVEGVADLVFRAPDAEAWVVVDFKTDRSLDARLAAYEVQLRWYAEAVRRATGQPARAFLLAV